MWLCFYIIFIWTILVLIILYDNYVGFMLISHMHDSYVIFFSMACLHEVGVYMSLFTIKKSVFSLALDHFSLVEGWCLASYSFLT